MSDTAELSRLLALAHSQRPDPSGWSLAVNVDWLERWFLAPGVSSRLTELPSGGLGAGASVRPDLDGTLIVTSMVRPDAEHLWPGQLAWIEARIRDAGGPAVRVVSECLGDRERSRWTDARFDLVFEEIAMDRDLTGSAEPRWPAGSTILDWGAEAAMASFEVYEAAFRERPGFPGWTREEWIEHLTGDADFLPEASMCLARDGVPAGFVVCSTGWVDQVGVAPQHRRHGLATALLAEATSRMRAIGIGVARLHVNTNNPAALASWRRLGWRETGRRGRFERVAALRAPGTT